MNEPEQRVQDALRELGVDAEVLVYDETTSTSRDAAAAAGCELGQIAKTLAFDIDGHPLLVIMAGDHQADTAKLSRFLGVARKRIKLMAPDQVERQTGYAVGGVPAVAHPQKLEILMDETLFRYDTVWSAAGSPNAIFPIGPDELMRISGARAADVSRSPAASDEGR
ncbi:MAG TPA: YbaK/EbsC family protein [Dehalococcoidia bacterium]|nr:YbaK/EbsC family protein [Dehalococcoidia bacterium]